jgi:uncharacterized protein YjdB
MKKSARVFAVVAVLAAIFGPGCASKPASVEISPPDAVINAPSEAPKLTTRVLDAKEQPIEDAKIVWSSSDANVVAIDPQTGALTVKASGKAEITAEAGAATGNAMITVALFKNLVPTPQKLQLRIGQAPRVSASVVDEVGETVEAVITWASADPKIATIDPERGEVHGISPGTTVVTATAKALKAEVPVEVMKPGPAELAVSKALVKLKAGKTAEVEGLPQDGNGNAVEGFPVSYASDDESIAKVEQDGTITAVAAGETNIAVTAGDQTVTIKVIVN